MVKTTPGALVVVLLSSCATGQAPPAPTPVAADREEQGGDHAVNAKLDRLLDAFEHNERFSGAVLVARRGRVTYRSARGHSDRGAKRANTPDTVFRVGSLSKQIVSAAVMQLVEGKKVSLAAPVAEHLPLFAGSPELKAITVRQLLTHTSGLADYTKVKGFWDDAGRAISPRACLRSIIDQKLHFEPGSRFEYSNTNYLALGMIVERVSGETLAAYLRRRVFTPCKMSHTGFSAEAAEIAKGYEYGTDREGTLIVAPKVHPSRYYAAGGLCSTVDDLHRFHRCLHGSRLLGSRSVEMMFRDPVDTGRGFKYGFGWIVQNADGEEVRWHTGSLPGYSARWTYYPGRDLLIVLLANFKHAPISRPPRSRLADDVAAVLTDRGYSVPVKRVVARLDGATLDGVVGTYEFAAKKGVKLELHREGDRIYAHIEVPNGKASPQRRIYPLDRDRYFYRVIDGSIQFERDADGRVRSAIFTQDGAELRATRVGAGDAGGQ